MLPTWSPSLDLETNGIELSNEQTIVCCSNSCSAREDSTVDNGSIDVSFVSVQAKMKTRKHGRIEIFGKPEDCAGCDTACKGFVFEICFEELQEYLPSHFSPAIVFPYT